MDRQLKKSVTLFAVGVIVVILGATLSPSVHMWVGRVGTIFAGLCMVFLSLNALIVIGGGDDD